MWIFPGTAHSPFPCGQQRAAIPQPLSRDISDVTQPEDLAAGTGSSAPKVPASPQGQILAAAPAPPAPSTSPFSPGTHPTALGPTAPGEISRCLPLGLCHLSAPSAWAGDQKQLPSCTLGFKAKEQNLCSRKRASYGLLSKISTFNS